MFNFLFNRNSLKKYFPFGDKDPYENPDFDRSFGLPEVKTALEYIRKNNLKEFGDLYYTLSFDKRSALLEGICYNALNVGRIMEWSEKNENNAFAKLLSGATWTYLAWQARTGLRAKEVEEKRWEYFHNFLNNAYKDLTKSIEINPNDPESFARMIRPLMGLSTDLDITTSYFNACRELDPEHFLGHIFYFNAVTYKWGGSEDMMLNFVKETLDSLSPGSPLFVLNPMANIEIWNEATEEDEVLTRHNFSTPDTLASVMSAYNQSVNSSEQKKSQYMPFVHNYFTFAFFLLGEQKLMLKERKSMGRFMTYLPWGYKGVISLNEADIFINQEIQDGE